MFCDSACEMCCLPFRKCFNASLGGVALLYSVDARLGLDLVCIEGPEGHREPLVPIGLG